MIVLEFLVKREREEARFVSSSELRVRRKKKVERGLISQMLLTATCLIIFLREKTFQYLLWWNRVPDWNILVGNITAFYLFLFINN